MDILVVMTSQSAARGWRKRGRGGDICPFILMELYILRLLYWKELLIAKKHGIA